jgi:hypothetical protein
MLLLCDEAEIRLPPALPAAWPAGRVTGLRVRGGFEIDLTWNNGALERAKVRSLLGQPLRVRRGTALRTSPPRAVERSRWLPRTCGRTAGVKPRPAQMLNRRSSLHGSAGSRTQVPFRARVQTRRAPAAVDRVGGL